MAQRWPAIALVIEPSSRPLPVLWAEMEVDDLASAAEELRKREGTSSQRIGRWPGGDDNPYAAENGSWASTKKLDGVVWTALGPKFANVDGRRPTQDEAVLYLQGLTGEVRDRAKEYVVNAPKQIDTTYRRALSMALDN
jgi:hypothetical protein